MAAADNSRADRGSRAMKHLLAPAALVSLAALASAAAPASAQSAGEKINMVIAYSADECPEAKEGEVVICEILVEAERYRIPSNLRYSDSPENKAWARQVEEIKYVGDFGAMSCSPAGAGGFTGCTQKFVEAAYKDRAEAENVRFGQLIEKARAERLSTIDTNAAAEQERVEMIEREYIQRLERERESELPGEGALPATTPPAEEPDQPE
jgi:membrane-bound lytic murein transglycosylase B